MNQELTILIQNIAFSYFWAFTILLILHFITIFSDSFNKKEELEMESNKVKATEGRYTNRVSPSLAGIIRLALYILSMIYM